MGAVLSVECERARARASLGLDGELSEVEQAHLRAHVGRCADCAAYAHDLERLTQELRSARPGVPSEAHRHAAAKPARRRSVSA